MLGLEGCFSFLNSWIPVHYTKKIHCEQSSYLSRASALSFVLYMQLKYEFFKNTLVCEQFSSMYIKNFGKHEEVTASYSVLTSMVLLLKMKYH